MVEFNAMMSLIGLCFLEGKECMNLALRRHRSSKVTGTGTCIFGFPFFPPASAAQPPGCFLIVGSPP